MSTLGIERLKRPRVNCGTSRSEIHFSESSRMNGNRRRKQSSNESIKKSRKKNKIIMILF